MVRDQVLVVTEKGESETDAGIVIAASVSRDRVLSPTHRFAFPPLLFIPFHQSITPFPEDRARRACLPTGLPACLPACLPSRLPACPPMELVDRIFPPNPRVYLSAVLLLCLKGSP